MIPSDLSNDGTYICIQCHRKMMCFTESGETEFCPMCGAVADNLIVEDEVLDV